MNLRIATPTGIVVERGVSKILACDGNGLFCLLPRHIDFVTALETGILRYFDTQPPQVVLQPLSDSFTVDSESFRGTGGSLFYPTARARREHRSPGEHWVALDGGILVKRGDEVSVAAWWAYVSDDPDVLGKTMRDAFELHETLERGTRAALAGLESNLVRRFLTIRTEQQP